jgi:Phage integrase family
VTPHRLRHAFGSNLADAGGGLDEIAALMGHASISSSQVYLHPDPARLREAVDRVRSPRELAGTDRCAPRRCRRLAEHGLSEQSSPHCRRAVVNDQGADRMPVS